MKFNLSDKARKSIKLVASILVWLIVAFAIFMTVFTIVTVSTVDKNERTVFGYRFYIVLSDSMSKSENNKDMDVHFNAGDIVIIKKVEDPTAFDRGDIIAFISMNDDTHGKTVTHMIDSVITNPKTGAVTGYKTYGTNTGAIDEAVVQPSYILGVYSGKLPYVGTFFNFIRTTAGYIVCILIPFLLLIIYNLWNIISVFRKYKAEQRAIMDAEKAEIAEERRRNEEMLRQLQELQAKLVGDEANKPVQTVEEAEEQKTEPVVNSTEEPQAEPVADEVTAEPEQTTPTEENGEE